MKLDIQIITKSIKGVVELRDSANSFSAIFRVVVLTSIYCRYSCCSYLNINRFTKCLNQCHQHLECTHLLQIRFQICGEIDHCWILTKAF